MFRRDIVYALRKKRPGVPRQHFILHMGNASSQTAETIAPRAALVLGCATIAHSPVRRIWRPSIFQYFIRLRQSRMGHRFDSPQELMTTTINITQQFRTEWYRDVYRHWVHRHRIYIEHSGEYFEKE